MTTKKCPNCGMINPAVANYCAKCDANFAAYSQGNYSEASNSSYNMKPSAVKCTSENIEPAFVKQNKRNLRVLVCAFGILVVSFVAIYLIADNNLTSNKLNGQYTAETMFGLNMITFSEDGRFARDAWAAGFWARVATGTYTLDGSDLTLYCDDGKIHFFYYEESDDSLVQEGFYDDVYIRTN